MGDFPFSRGQIVLSGGAELWRGHAAPVAQPPEVGQELGPDVNLCRVIWRPVSVPAASVIVGARAALGGVLAVRWRGGGVCRTGARGVGEAKHWSIS